MMNTLGRTVVEVVALLGLAIVLGFSVNTVHGRIKPTKNYFAMRPPPSRATDDAGATGDPADAAADAEEPTHAEHRFQEISFDAVADLLESAADDYIFVDARADAAFEDGHIPGAIQCDHYHLEDFIDDVLQYTAVVDKVIVYCNGGDCTDSNFVCQDLEDYGVPRERIYLFAGGWTQWRENDMPYEEGN